MRLLYGAVCALFVCVGSAQAQFQSSRTTDYRVSKPSVSLAKPRALAKPSPVRFKKFSVPNVGTAQRDRQSSAALAYRRKLNIGGSAPHSVQTIGNGTTTGARSHSLLDRIYTVQSRSPRITPERPTSHNYLRDTYRPQRVAVSYKTKHVETSSAKAQVRRVGVASATLSRAAANALVWTTKGDPARGLRAK
jgi:hypothetical protein